MVFPTIYTDNAGIVITHFETDGKIMQFTLRGITFTGHDFDLLSLVNETDYVGPGITLDQWGCLTNCTLEISIPIRIRQFQEEKMATLSFRLLLENGKINAYDQLSLQIDEYNRLDYPDKNPDFLMEGILPFLKRDLPENVMLLCCFDCAFAHYSPGGNSAFGGMSCYKNVKTQVLQITNKSDFMALQDLYREKINLTQETWYCKEFQPATPDVWRYL
ncbi:DUF6304 family protein [Chitinophaga sp.]|uniref:DUF6304 family protein n=1 Tax=Chitinophaga sp. TaxID=1869181 RepID=UPI002F934CD5